MELLCESLKPQPDVLTIGESGTDTEYRELCNKLGIRNRATVKAELEAILHDEGIRVYKREAVKRYMDDLVGQENGRLARQADADREEAKTKSAQVAGGTLTFVGPDGSTIVTHRIDNPVLTFFGFDWPRVTWGWQGIRKCDMKRTDMAGLYPHAIPYPVLLTMDRILERIPDALFFVSNYEAVKPDPFLLVSHKELGLEGGYVIEKWDEPRFRD